MATEIRLPFSASPVYTREATVAPGTLLYVDPTNPIYGPWASGVPSVLPNLAWEEAKALIGSGTEESLGISFTNAWISGDGVVERSSKGGLHIAPKQKTYGGTNRAVVGAAAWLRSYITANPTHSYYLGVIGRYTQVALGTPDSTYRIAGFKASGTNTALAIQPNAAGITAGPSTNRTNLRAKTTTALEPFAVNASWSALGAAISTDDFLRSDLSVVSSGTTAGPGFVIYRIFLEDLTVSGRTYARLDAAAVTWLAEQVTASGGRYNGDTYTAP